MAKNTSKDLRNLSIYSIYLRNHGKINTFDGLKNDLKRIKSMNFDAIWLLPVHPIGTVNKKGTLGCPYSIKDYGEINPNYGTKESFKDFIDASHKENLKVIIDVVYNHTSYDSLLYKTHPKYFIKNNKGEPICKADDWTDVIDLDYSNRDLWKLLIDYLKEYSDLGVDGFRCDVASLVPVEFWKEAREKIAKINPNTIWLAESVHKSFIKELSVLGYKAYSDSELYQAFDILYDYDIHPEYMDFIGGKISLTKYIDSVKNQDKIYPKNYVKLRFIENHDQKRMSSLVKTMDEKINFTILSYLLKGATLVYAGQETKDTFTPSLFEKDPVNFDGTMPEYVNLINTLNTLTKDEIFKTDKVKYEVINEDLLVIRYDRDQLLALINFSEKPISCDLNLIGNYINILENTVINSAKPTKINKPLIFKKIK